MYAAAWRTALKNVTDWILVSSPACTYKSQECRLTIHYEHGFSLTTEPQDGAFSKTIAQYPYEKLKMSSDDGIRMLYLDFGEKDGEIVSTAFSKGMHVTPQAVGVEKHWWKWD